MKLPALLTCLLLPASLPATPAQAQEKVLRQAFKVAETGFDPAQITDLYSKAIVAGILDAPLEYDFGARPFKLRPATLSEMPEISADFKTITMRVKPGIYFADDPAFKGKKRELTAEDYVLQRQAPLRPAMEERQPLSAGERQDPGPVGAAHGTDEGQEALRLRPRGRGPQSPGPLHLPDQARRGRPALRLPVQRRWLPGRHGARGGRVLWRQDHGAPGRHQRLAAG